MSSTLSASAVPGDEAHPACSLGMQDLPGLVWEDPQTSVQPRGAGRGGPSAPGTVSGAEAFSQLTRRGR